MTRVLLHDLPPLVRDLLEQELDARADLQIVQAATDTEDLAALIASCGAEWVVVPLSSDAWPDGCIQLMTSRAGLRLLGVDTAEGGSRLYELTASQRELGPLSPHELAERIGGRA